MKSDCNKSRYYIECNCGNPEHLLIFDFWEWDYTESENDGSIDIFFTGNWYQSFWERVVLAFKFIFSRKFFYLSDSVWITKENIKQLEEVINRIKGEQDAKKD